MDGPWTHYAKWDKLAKDKYCMYHLYVESQKAKLIKTKSEMVVTRGWEYMGIGQMLFKGTSLQQIKKSPRDLMHDIVNTDNNIVL